MSATTDPARVLPAPVLTGVEVTLRPLAESDLDALALAASEPSDDVRYSSIPTDARSTATFVRQAFAQRGSGFRMPFTIVWNGRVVGSTSYSELLPWSWPDDSPLRRSDRPDAVEVGYTWLAPSARRTRVNTEAKFLLFSYAFEHWDVHSIALRTDQRNARSHRAIERLGAKVDGLRRAHAPGADGTVRTSVFFSIVREEWPEVRAQLERLLARDSAPVRR